MPEDNVGLVSFKIHVYRGTNAGSESCDFTGEHEIGEAQEDHHRTIPKLEMDPCPDDWAEFVREHGPSVNAFFEKMKEFEPAALGQLASALGLKGEGPVGIRVGLWPGDGKR